MNPADSLSQSFLQDLYAGKPTTLAQPVLQILGFETSEHNPKEITYLFLHAACGFPTAWPSSRGR